MLVNCYKCMCRSCGSIQGFVTPMRTGKAVREKPKHNPLLNVCLICGEELQWDDVDTTEEEAIWGSEEIGPMGTPDTKALGYYRPNQ